MSEPAAQLAAAVGERWDAWDRFIEAHPAGGFMQSSWWADFRTNAGYDHIAIIARHEGEIVGGGIVHKFSWAEDACFYYMPDGPMLPADRGSARHVLSAVMQEIEAHCREEDDTVSHLRVEPRLEASNLNCFHEFEPRDELSDPYMEPRTSLCIDLRASEDEILTQMKPKGRYNIRVAGRHGVRIVEDNSATGLHDFLEIYEEMTARQQISPKPEEYFEALLYQLIALERGTIYFAEYEGQRLAAAIVVWFGPRATYFFGASRDEQRHVMAPYRLHFEIIQRMKARGCEWYDLWGVSPPGEDDHHLAKISAFKRKLGGCEISLVPTMDRVFDDAAYRRYKEETSD